MATLKVDPVDFSATKKKAVADAKMMQASIIKECNEADLDPPPYVLSELIGKGSFGRVYKAVGTGRPEFVAVKIISIDEGDSLAPGAADTFRDILKEVDTLKLLNSSGAKNINTIIDTLLVGHSMWMVTEYCAGGSVATLMKPTGFLAEKWIKPILREVAVGIYWVHKQGIIHRDIKCANVLVTDDGGVQLCDFGVAGIVETKTDKRKTVTGTLQWMAPEFFDSQVSYGTEVDIWAFGSMAFEAATGAPPNATNITDISQFGSYLKDHCPRLEGDQYSTELKSIVTSCMVQDPARRPSIEQLQKHPYLFNTEEKYPAESLSKLVHAYKLWEIQGGSRRSLFSAGGAQCQLSNESSFSDNWNFDDVPESDPFACDSDAQKVHEVYGSRVDFPPHRPGRQARRRRPTDIRPPKAPLEKLFDRNTISNYNENTRAFYSKTGRTSVSSADAGDKPGDRTVRGPAIVSPVELDIDTFDLAQSAVPRVTDPDTRNFMTDIHAEAEQPQGDSARPRRPSTKEWTFPVTVPTSPTLDATHLQSSDSYTANGPEAERTQPDNKGAPATDESTGMNMSNMQQKRLSSDSLIDLDAGLPYVPTHTSHPSTASSDSTSTSSSAGNPFHLEQLLESTSSQTTCRPPSIFTADNIGRRREPSLYIDDDSFFNTPAVTPPNGVPTEHEAVQDSDSGNNPGDNPVHNSSDDPVDPDATPKPRAESRTESNSITSLPSLPEPPSARVMENHADKEEVKAEFQRLAASFGEHFKFLGDTLGRGAQATFSAPSMQTSSDVKEPRSGLGRKRKGSGKVAAPNSEVSAESEPEPYPEPRLVNGVLIHGVGDSWQKTGRRPRFPIYPELIADAVKHGLISKIPDEEMVESEHSKAEQSEESPEKPPRKRHNDGDM